MQPELIVWFGYDQLIWNQLPLDVVALTVNFPLPVAWKSARVIFVQMGNEINDG